MNNIVELVLINLEKVGIGVVIFLGAYLANIGLGAWKNVTIEGYEFDWKLIGRSALKFLVIGICIGLLSCVVSVLPAYVTYIGITIEQEVLDTIDSLVIIGAFMTATIRYIADAINKVKVILGVSTTE